MKAIKNQFLTKIQVGFLCAATLCPMPADFWSQEVFKGATNISPAGLDTYRREKLAELLVPSDPKKVYLELPETKAAQNISVKDLTDEELLIRARVLTQWNRNDAVLETLSDLPVTCEISYLKSLAFRRLRKYSDAKNSLKKTIEICDGDFKRKALYLNARIAAMSSSEKSLEVLNLTLNPSPASGEGLLESHVDDVLLWKSHILKDLKRDDEASKTLDEVIALDGDMREQATFERALNFVAAGDLDSGIKLLERLNTAQGTYWRGRLMLHPELTSLKLNDDQKKQAQGKKILRELAEKSPASYYGYFAARLAGLKSFTKPKKFKLPKSEALQADPTYKILLCLKKSKQFEEAVWVLDRLARAYTGEAERFILAQQYLDLNRPDKAHQLMRSAGLAFPRFNSAQNYPWQLAFPRAYAKDFLKAARQEKLPLDWITGLSREESQFDSQVISWAGAVGLCQLLPSTARLKEAELLNPEVNIETGAKHLKELSEELWHPLKAIAAYNAGERAVKRWVKQNPDIPMDYFVELIPYEQTRNYVKKVSSAWLTYAWLEGRLQQHLYPL